MLRAALIIVHLSASLAGAMILPRAATAQNVGAGTPDLVPFVLRPAMDPAPEGTPEPPRRVRDVTPPGITPGPRVDGPLTRLAPAKPEPEPADQPRFERLFNPLVTSAGTLKLRERQIRLAGIAAPEFAARCGDATGPWPCGRIARAELRRLIRGRAVECALPEGADALPDPADCSVAGQSLSEWLVRFGWAAAAGERFAGLEAEARSAKRGLWGPGPRAGQPPLAAAAVEPASAPESALPMRARLSGTP